MELNLNRVERVGLGAGLVLVLALLLAMWLSAPIGAERFTEPAGVQLVPGSVDPAGPGCGWALQS